LRPVLEHRWDLSPKEAIELQKQLADRVILRDECGPLRTVCGLDVSYDKTSDLFFAVAAVLSYPALTVVEIARASSRSPFPYVPGLLSFREIPVVREALSLLKTPPDLFVCDGQGYAHPRHFGLACHLGVLYDLPCIGAAKSRLFGEYKEPAQEKGSWTWLVGDERHIGQVVRTRAGVAPLFVSPGHRISFHAARKIALSLCPKWRLPETTRMAHHEVNQMRRENL